MTDTRKVQAQFIEPGDNIGIGPADMLDWHLVRRVRRTSYGTVLISITWGTSIERSLDDLVVVR